MRYRRMKAMPRISRVRAVWSVWMSIFSIRLHWQNIICCFLLCRIDIPLISCFDSVLDCNRLLNRSHCQKSSTCKSQIFVKLSNLSSEHSLKLFPLKESDLYRKKLLFRLSHFDGRWTRFLLRIDWIIRHCDERSTSIGSLSLVFFRHSRLENSRSEYRRHRCKSTKAF